MKQKLQFLALFLVFSASTFAQTFDVNNLRYTVISGTDVSVRKTDVFPTGNLSIPSTVVYNGSTYTVISVEQSGFSSCPGLTSVIIPNSITTIGQSAFAFNPNITSINIPSSLTSIPNLFCYGCSITSLNIPNSVTNIGAAAFFGCDNLNSLIIPNSVTFIGEQSFLGCSSLTSLIIGSSVNTIQDQAFLNCTGLTSVTVNWATPLVINANVFQNVNTSVIPLNVPAGSGALYEANAVWTTFNPINEVLSTEDFNRTKINVYPNPTTNYITVSGLLNSETYVIYDMMGRQLQNGVLNNNDTINIENLATGKYLLQFSNGASSTILKN